MKSNALSAARILKLALVFLLALSASPAFAAEELQEETFDLENTKELENFVDSFFASGILEQTGAPGAAVAIVKKDRVLLTKGYGYANTEENIPFTPDTIFRIASITKAFAATAAMQVVEQGLVDLNENIESYLGGLTLRNPFDEPVTMKHLLTHTTGFDYTDVKPSDIHYDFNRRTSMEEFLRERMPSVRHKPGEVYKYDNIANLLQGYIVEQVTGMPFETYMEEHIFQPLGMKHSGFIPDASVRSAMAIGYAPDGSPILPYAITPTVAPHGGMYSTAHDMARFMMAHLNGGALDGNRILSEASIRDMHTFHYAVHPKKPNMTYGFEASFHELHNGRYVIEKAGDIDGFSSWLWLLPEEDTGIFIAYNTNGFMLRTAFMQAMMDRYFPDVSEAPEFLSLSREELARFEGIYRDLRKGYQMTRITAADGKLLVEDSLGGITELRPVEPLLFIDPYGMSMAFKEQEDGSIKYMMYLNPYSLSMKMDDPEPFADVPANHPYHDSIAQLQKLGVLTGREDHTLGPAEPLTRGEFARMLAKLLDLPPAQETPEFLDLTGSVYAADIAALAELDLVQGVSAAAFEPERAISRQEAAVILWRTLVHTANAQPSAANIAEGADDWAEEAVRSLAARGLHAPETEAKADGRVNFRPKDPLLRQEAAYMLYHAFQGLYREFGFLLD